MILTEKQTRCVYCGENGLETSQEKIICAKCKHEYPKFGDVVFLGSYKSADTFGLMEVTSKISTNIDPIAMRANRAKAETELKAAFEKAYADGGAVGEQHVFGSKEMANSVRLREWGSFALLSKDIDFNGKLCFDNGAGLGSDSQRLIDRGANVVCLDFNPISVKNGAQVVPDAQWICGNSEYLPFVDNTFDISVANAALHHMHDIPTSVGEMLRVTKPGGYIFLISDPFMEDVEDRREQEDVELFVFDKHPMVLGGVNESYIPFNKYREVISEQHDIVLLTMKIHKDSKFGDQAKFWKLDDSAIKHLGTKKGNISSRFKVNESAILPNLKDREEIPTSAFFATIGNPQKSISFLLPYLPEEVFDTFPFTSKSKFNLLNGWHAKQDYETEWRSGYYRARLYLSDVLLQNKRHFEIKRLPNAPEEAIDVYFSVNGNRLNMIRLLNDEPERLSVDTNVELQPRNMIEIGIADVGENKGAVWNPYDEKNAFAVRMIPSRL